MGLVIGINGQRILDMLSVINYLITLPITNLSPI